MGCNRHYYVYKDDLLLSKYDDYDKAEEHRDLVDGKIVTEDE